MAYPHSAAGQVEPAVTRAVSRSSVRRKATTSRRSRAPSPTPRPRWRSPRADVLPVASPIDGTDRRPRLSREAVVEGVRPRRSPRSTSEHTCRSQAGHHPGSNPAIRLGPERTLSLAGQRSATAPSNRRPLPAALVLPPPSPPPAPPAVQSSDPDTTPPRRPVRQTRDRHRWHSPSPASESSPGARGRWTPRRDTSGGDQRVDARMNAAPAAVGY